MNEWMFIGGIIAVIIIVAVLIIVLQKRRENKAKQLEVNENELDFEDDLLGNQVPNYNALVLTTRQYVLIAFVACDLFFIIGFIFYKSTITALIFSTIGYLYT